MEGTNASSPRRLSRQNSDGSQVISATGEPREHTIDCGDIVWGLAFGSSVPEKQSRCVNIEWHRFKFGQDQLLLATGLSNGRIKIWDVYTGEGQIAVIAKLSQMYKLKCYIFQWHQIPIVLYMSYMSFQRTNLSPVLHI